MAHSTVAALSLDNFHSPFDRLTELHLRCVDRILAEAQLSTCQYESPESRIGACDGQPCLRKATVYTFATESEHCLGHHLEVSRG